MKMKPFSEEKPPKDQLVLIKTADCGYRLAAYSKLGGDYVWRLQGSGRYGKLLGDYHPTENTSWCKLPE